MTTMRYAVTVTRWTQDTATNEHGPYLTGGESVESVAVTECADRAALDRELEAHAVGYRDGRREESGSVRHTRYLLTWAPIVDEAAVAAAFDECPLPLVAADGRQLPMRPTTAADLADQAVAVLAARGITLSPEVERQVRESAAGASAAAAADRARGPVVDEAVPELMSVTEVAEALGITRTAVQKMIDAGRLPARRAGTTWIVRRAVAEAMVVDE